MLSNEEIKEKWAPECFICNQVMTNRNLVKAIVPLEVSKPECDAFFTRTYCVCNDCLKGRELV